MIFSDKFVCATREYNSYENHVSNPQFRYSFTLDAVPQNAEITICGLGYYKLYLNGKDITKGFMAPYRSNLNHYLYYDNYNLSQLLQKGENVIGVLLGNGFLNPSIDKWDFCKIPYRSAPMVALCVEADGKVLFDATKLKCTESPITFDEFHSGEYYDARLEIDSWQEKGWKTASKSAVKNVDLWETLLLLVKTHKVNFIKVKGHADNEYNNKCDKIAVEEYKKL